jgi:hypothetical protein
MNTKEIWVVEAHDLGALQVRTAGDALTINRKRWLAGKTDAGRQRPDAGPGEPEDRTGKADRLLVGIGETIDEALEVERELKRMRKNAPDHGEPVGDTVKPVVGSLKGGAK